MRFSSLFWAVALLISVSETASAAEAPRPNILVFYVDDMGWGSIGPNGQADRRAANLPCVQTPNLDRLAVEGVNFTRGYGCHVCSPARSSLMTGFHQGHTFADRNDPNNARKAIRKDDVSIGTALSNAGYATGYWGKWGYGGSKDIRTPVIENIQTLPTSHGFQHVLAELHHVRAHTFFQPTLWSAPAPEGSVGGLHLTPNSMQGFRGDSNYPDAPALQNHSGYPQTAYCDDSYAFAALKFVREQGDVYNKSGQPFLGIMAVQIPHAPFGEISTLPNWDAAYQDDPHFKKLKPQSQQWAAMVTRIDAHFGNILAALEDPNSDGDLSDSIADNTLVIFQSDNGGPGGSSHVDFNANGGLSGTKGKIQEGGIRVPLVMRWPEKIHTASILKPGSETDIVVDCTDLLPTFCDLAGAEIPVGIDGVSIAATLSGLGHQRKRRFIIHEASNGQSIIKGKYKLVRERSSEFELYDLQVDPAEAVSIAVSHPRIKQQLERLLLDEQVLQPKGFANSYHKWLGSDGSKTSDASCWSEYEYSNAGISYMNVQGPPQPSWIADVANEGDATNRAVIDSDLSVLGLSVRGNSKTKAQQIIQVNDGRRLVGRNEVRVANLGTVRLNGGSVETLRWIEILAGGILEGHGMVEGDVYQSGDVRVFGNDSTLSIAGDLVQQPNATLRLSVVGSKSPIVKVQGVALISGTLELEFGDLLQADSTAAIVLIRAEKIQGKFTNSDGQFFSSGATKYQIEYGKTEVVLNRL